MTASEYVTIIGVITSSLLAIIAAIGSILAAMRSTANRTEIKQNRSEIQAVAAQGDVIQKLVDGTATASRAEIASLRSEITATNATALRRLQDRELYEQVPPAAIAQLAAQQAPHDEAKPHVHDLKEGDPESGNVAAAGETGTGKPA